MNSKKIIGVLGGMGHACTVHFLQLLVEYQQKVLHCVQDGEFYKSIIYNTALEEWNNTGFVNLESVKEQLLKEIKRLDDFGCDVIVVPCNTVHHFYLDMKNAVKTPMISIIEETSKRAIESGIKKVGILCSKSTRELELYKKYLDIEILYPLEQDLIDAIIEDVQAGRNEAFDAIMLNGIMQEMINDGAEAIIVGCTELSIPLKNSILPIYDSSKILCEALFKEIE